MVTETHLKRPILAAPRYASNTTRQLRCVSDAAVPLEAAVAASAPALTGAHRGASINAYSQQRNERNEYRRWHTRMYHIGPPR